MFVWLASGVAWLTAVAIWIGHARRWPLSRLWWLAGGGAFGAWLLSLASIPWHGAATWHGLANGSAPWPAAVWRLDEHTWPFVVIGASAAWVALLMEAGRGTPQQENAQGWGALVWMGGLAPLAALGASPAAVVMGWALLDATALVADVLRLHRPHHREAAIWAFFWRAVTWMLALAATAGTKHGQAISLWWLAVTSRLVIAAAVQPTFVTADKPRWRLVLGVENLLATLAAAQWAAGNTPHPLNGWTFTGIALVALWGAWRWGHVGSPLQAFASGGLALGGLAVLAASQGLTSAWLGWALLALSVPAGIAWTPHRHRTTWPFLLAMVLPLSLWPIAPTASGLTLWQPPWRPWHLLAGLTWVVSVWAVARWGRRLPLPAQLPSREGRAFCLTGMGLWATTLWGWRLWPPFHLSMHTTGMWAWGAGVAVMMAGALAAWASRRVQKMPSRLQAMLARETTHLMARLFWGAYRLTAQGLRVFSLLLEGEGGALWALVLLVMLAVLLQR